MAQGFASTSIKKQGDDYQTLFDIVKSKSSKGEGKSLSWYRGIIKEISGEYKPSDKYVVGKQQEINQLRNYTAEGHLYMFEYTAKMRWLPYYDRFPLVYVLKSTKDEFWGINLHYMSPKKRFAVAKNLMRGQVNAPKACFHKYIHKHVEKGIYLDLSVNEWDTAILLPTEDFVKNINGIAFPINKNIVWEETNDTFNDKIKGHRK